MVGPQPLQGALNCGADAHRTAVGDAGVAPGVRDDAELRRHHHLVTSVLDRSTRQLLAVERAVHLGRVDVGDPEFDGAVDGADRLGVVQAPPEV